MADSALKKKTISSLLWSFLDKFGQQLLNFVSMLVLMNIVSTEDYGLIGSLSVFMAFIPILIDSGFGRALINRKDVGEEEYSSVFYFNVGLSVLLYAVLFFAAPAIASLFNAPLLSAVSRVLFLGIVFNAFRTVQYTRLTKKADFKGLTKTNMWALLVANIVAITMALLHYGVWALVVQQMLYAFLRTVFLWIYSPWRPSRSFEKKALQSLFGFSNKLLLTSIIQSVVNNIYPSLIAVFYPMNQVAFFDRAKKYQEIPFTMLSDTFRSVSVLILSEINDQTERLKRVVSKMMKSIAFLSFPIGFVMIVVAEPTFFLFFREKWLASVPYFQVLTLGGMFFPFTFIFNELFIARERSDFFLGLEVVKGVVLLMLIGLFFREGIMGLAASWVVYVLIILVISSVMAKKAVSYTPGRFVCDILPYMLVAFVCAAASYWITRPVENNLLYILANAVLTGFAYLFICRLLKLEMSEEIKHWFDSKKKRSA
ncbi:MAG TPA: hypothetical protein DIC46_15025 [Porphyromonadaceae bacterium]|nr:hypothetical protein [Porphyromonadaceae bacterium]